jgi:hypothetical protein
MNEEEKGFVFSVVVSILTGSVHLYHFLGPKLLENKVKLFDSNTQAKLFACSRALKKDP